MKFFFQPRRKTRGYQDTLWKRTWNKYPITRSCYSEWEEGDSLKDKYQVELSGKKNAGEQKKSLQTQIVAFGYLLEAILSLELSPLLAGLAQAREWLKLKKGNLQLQAQQVT